MNGHLLYERRTELGISIPSLARAAGVTHRLIESLERKNWAGESTTPLRTLRSLADALGLDPGALLAWRPRDHAAEGPSQTDAALLGNVLSRVTKPVTHADIATELGWNASRIEEAVGALRAALATTGQSLVADLNGLRIAPASDREATAAATEMQTHLIEEDETVLHLIWKVWVHRKAGLGSGQYTDAELALAQKLLASHVLEIDNAGRIILASAVCRALAPAMPTELTFAPGAY